MQDPRGFSPEALFYTLTINWVTARGGEFMASWTLSVDPYARHLATESFSIPLANLAKVFTLNSPPSPAV